MLPIRVVLLVAALSALALPGRAQQAETATPATAEEAPLRIRYLPWVDALVMAIHVDGKFYLPASEVLRRLGITNELQHSRQRLSGFYLREQTRYSIDLVARAATMGDRAIELRDGEAQLGELDLFVVPAVFERLFGWRVTLDPLSLEVRVESRESLPVANMAPRNQRSTAKLLPQDTNGIRFARRRQILNGGTIDYAVSAERSDAGARYSLDFVIGAELLGGELQARVRGHNERRSGVAPHVNDIRWRSVLENSAVLSQVTIGRVLASGLRARSIHGFQITNQPIEPRTLFGTHVLHGTTGAEWDVEIYVNERLIARTKADPLGRYRMDVPLGYGSATMRLRHLGPSGEVREEESRVDVPFTFLPPGRIGYVLTAGKHEQDGGRGAQAEVGVGLTSWLTARSGMEYDQTSDDGASPLPYHNLSARVGPHGIVGAKLSPGALQQISGEWRLGSRGHFSAVYTRYGEDRRLNGGQLVWEWDGSGYLPVAIGSIPVTLRLGGGERANESGTRMIRADAEAIVSLGAWLPSVGYRSGTAAPDGELRATSLLFVGHQLPAPLRNAVLRASYARPMDGGDSNRFDIGFSTQVTRHQRIDVAFSGPRSGRLEVRLQFESRPIRATTSVRRQGGAVVWSQSASGSLAVDPHRARVTASGRPLVGRGGVSVRFFLDENGNGRLDSGEERVAGAVTRFDRMAVFRSSQPGEVIATDLLAYHRYHAEVDTRLVPNPLWRPQFTSFSFVADPNRFQTIEIPFYTAGTAQGMVVRRVDSAERPVAGLKVLVSSADGSVLEVISTFADGSFYHEGLPPGRYIVRLDAAQLDILGVTSHPSERVVDLQPGRDGVSIEGLDFLLLPRTDGASQ